jgi:hypothetical protein
MVMAEIREKELRLAVLIPFYSASPIHNWTGYDVPMDFVFFAISLVGRERKGGKCKIGTE